MTFIRFAGTQLGLMALGSSMAYTLVPHYNRLATWWCVAAVLVCGSLTIAGFYMANRGLAARPGQFINAVLGSTLLKLAASMAFIAVVGIVADASVLTPLIVCYFAAYLAFTAFEVWALLANLRRVSK